MRAIGFLVLGSLLLVPQLASAGGRDPWKNVLMGDAASAPMASVQFRSGGQLDRRPATSRARNRRRSSGWRAVAGTGCLRVQPGLPNSGENPQFRKFCQSAALRHRSRPRAGDIQRAFRCSEGRSRCGGRDDRCPLRCQTVTGAWNLGKLVRTLTSGSCAGGTECRRWPPTRGSSRPQRWLPIAMRSTTTTSAALIAPLLSHRSAWQPWLSDHVDR